MAHASIASIPPPRPARPFPLSIGIRRAFAAGYAAQSFRADLMAGAVVGVVALPLSMALAIAVGVPPQHGLYTAVVAGAVVALTGGSKFQITGPTAAFVVILAPIVTKHGLSGLLTAGFMAGLILVAMGVARFGKLIQYIPNPVTTGFTTGIATVIATLQLKDALGLHVERMPDSYVDKLVALWDARGSASLAEVAVAGSTLGLLLVIPRITKRIPSPLLAIGLVAVVAALAHRWLPGFEVATIGSRFHAIIGDHVVAGIPPLPPHPRLPWGDAHLDLAYLRELLPSAFAIAILGAIESLLSAVIADGMTGKRHDPNAELIGLGLGNLVAPFFGGIAATGALARTATNIRAGACSPIAAVVHSGVVLLSIVLLAPLVAYIPMASLAGLLLLVAWNMSEARHFVHILKVAPKSDVAVLLTCYLLTVVFDMVISVSAGVILAALLFMRRMAELTHARAVLDGGTEESSDTVPDGVRLYEIAGPLFFGAAQAAMTELEVTDNPRVVVIDLAQVPAIDATGIVALESALARLRRSKIHVILAGPLPEPRRVFEKANIASIARLVGTRAEALALAAELVDTPPSTLRIPAHA